MNLMPEEQPQVITTSRFKVPKIFLGLLGAIILISLGFLILRGSAPKTPPATAQPTPTPKVSISCPIEGFCKRAKTIEKNGKPIAIASNLPAGTSIRAVFDGKTIIRSVSAAGNSRETFYSVSLSDETQNLKAVYYFKDEQALGFANKIAVKESLKSGEVLASTSATPIKFFNNNNFAFSLLDKDNQIIPTENIEFR